MRAMLGAWAVALGLWMLYGFTWIWRGVFLLSLLNLFSNMSLTHFPTTSIFAACFTISYVLSNPHTASQTVQNS
jgi:hypothetical protein